MIEIPIHDPVLIFSIVMLNVLIAPILAEKLKLPGIVGFITSGFIFGPHLFGILERDRTIELLGTIGLLYIMFQAGLEINIGEVKKNKHYSIIFGILTFIIPLLLGIAGGYYLLKLSLMASILLASMFSSHTLLTFPIASKMGLVKKRAVSSTIGGTIITDTLALMILAVIIKANHGNLNLVFWVQMFSFMIFYVIAINIILPYVCRWFFKKFSSDDGQEEYVFIIAALFMSAYLSHVAGFEPIIGAFLAGLALNKLIPEKSVLMNRIRFVGESLFIPFFLISVGMIINPRVFISDIYTIEVSIVMIITAVISKYMAAFIFGKTVKFSKNESMLMFGLSVNQAAATLAAVLVGYRVGIFNESILGGTILMIMVTCFIGAMVTAKYARKVLSEIQNTKEEINSKLTERILIPIKNPNNLNNLIDIAFYLHDKKSEEPIYPLNVVLDGTDIEKQIVEGENLLTKVIIRGNAAKKNIIPLNKIDTNISNAILKAAKEQRVSKVIFGWNENVNFKYKLFNTVIEQFVKNSNDMIFIAKILYSIGISKSIILIIPPLINKQNGFTDTMNSIIRLAQEINDKLILVSEEKTIEEIRVITDKLKNIEINFKNINNWKTLPQEMEKIISKNDIIIHMLARQGHLAWGPIFDKLPYIMSEKFPENNMMIVYPYYYIEEETETKEIKIIEDSFLKDMNSENCYFNSKEGKIEKIFYNISENKKYEYKEEIYKQLKAVSEESPIELTKEILVPSKK